MSKELAAHIAKDFVEVHRDHFKMSTETRERDYKRFNRVGIGGIVFSSADIVQVALTELLESLLTSSDSLL